MHQSIKIFLGMLLDLVYPRRCPVCDKAVKPFGALICESCKKEIKYIKAPFCQKCGKELKDRRALLCHDCMQKEHYYDRGMAVFAYPSIADSIFRFKYKNRREYAAYYGERMASILGERILAWKPDALIPVPIHASKKQIRGYNQAELLALELGRRLGIPVETELIVRTRKTRAMKDLSAQERQNNLKRAFKICRNDVKLNTVIIIDDIYTTGCTVDAMAQELHSAGIKCVYFATLAIGKGM